MLKNEYLKKKLRDLPDEEWIDVMDDATDRAVDVDDSYKDELVPIGENADEVEEAIKDWGKFNGISTGWVGVDDLTYGWLPGELIIMGGEPGVGKSAFICALAVNLAKDSAIMPTIVSMELTLKQVRIRVAKNYGKDWDALPIILQKHQMIRRRDFIRIIKNAKEGGSNLIIVDYLQMLKDDSENEHREVSKIVKLLKSLALEHDVTIIAISSLNRGRDSQAGLQMKDLHGSGTIEYYADQVIFLEKTDTHGVIQAKIVKNRSNPLNWDDNTRLLNFDGSKFVDQLNTVEDPFKSA